MKKRYLSILLALSLGFSTLPAPAFAEDGGDITAYAVDDTETQAADTVYVSSTAQDGGDGTENKPFNTFDAALAAVNDGGTIIIQGNTTMNVTKDDGYDPFILTKAVTIEGSGYSDTLSVRASGIVLGANLTLENLSLMFASRYHNAIFVNGYQFSATNVKMHESSGLDYAHIFAGGLGSGTQATVSLPSSGNSAQITLKNSSFAKDSSSTYGNIYSGGMNTSFSGNVSISLSSAKVENIFGSGAPETVPDGSNNWFDTNAAPPTPPAANASYTAGKVTISTSSSSITSVDGRGATQTDMTVTNAQESKKLNLNGIHSLKVSGGSATLSALNTDASVTLESNAAIDFSAVALAPENAKEAAIKNLSGSGKLILGKDQKLTVTDALNGTYQFETSGGFNGKSGEAEYDHTYIVQNSGSADITFTPHNSQSTMTLTKAAGSNEWKTSPAPTMPDKVTAFSFTKTAETMSASDFQSNGLIIPVSWTSDPVSDSASLAYIPFRYEVTYNSAKYNGTSTSTDGGAYEATFVVNGTTVEFAGADAYDGDPDCITFYAYDNLSAGEYTITVYAPKTSGETSATFTLTVTDGTETPSPAVKTLEKIEVTTPPTKTAYTAGEKFDKTGMVVTATYSNQSTAAVTGYTFTPDGALSTSDTTITISYTEGGVTKTTTQAISVTDAAAPAPTEKKEITADMFQVQLSDLTYDGKDQRSKIDNAIGKKEAYKDKFGEITKIVKLKNNPSSGDLQSVTDVGEYNIYVTCAGDAEYNPVTELLLCTISMKPREISVADMTVTQKTFDGTTALSKDEITAVTFGNLPSGATFAKDSDYEILSCQYKTANVESSKKVSYTIRLKNSNYAFANSSNTVSGEVSVGGTIKQADAPTDLKSETVYRKVNSSASQEVSVASVGMPANAGTLKYAIDESSAIYTANKDKFAATINENTGLLTIMNVMGSAGDSVVIPIRISSTNYKDAAITVTVALTDKDVPTLKAENISANYSGTALSESLIKGTAEFGGKSVAGTWKWTGAAPKDATYDEGNTFSVTFTPDDTENYAPATTDITVIIKRASLTGAPIYTKITESGKTLADAKLTANPDWLAKTTGTLEWIGNTPDTVVTQGTAYKWAFTPDNSNYKDIEGEIILWEKPASSKPSGSSSSGSSSSGGGSSSASVKVPASSDHSTVNISATVSKGTASVSLSRNQIDQVISDGKTDVAIDVSGLKNVDSAKLPANIISAANAAEDISLTVMLPTGSVSLDDQALASLPNTKAVTISVEQLSLSGLTAAQKAAIGDQAEAALVVDVNILVGSVKQSDFGSGKLTISVPYTLKDGEDPANLAIWFIRDDGTIENKGGTYDAKQKCFIFETEHLSKYILVNLKETKAEAPIQEIETYTPANFLDVSENAYYADAVAWAAANGITGGISKNYFAPDQACTRAQVVAFLWRAAGKPAAASDVHFSDVKPNAYYSEAIRWAAENGIISGYSNGLFGTNDPITREQMVAILYRYAQSIGMDTTQGGMAVREFLDYADISGYAVRAMQWAVNADILKGAGGYIMPDASCTRAQIVSFLYRIHQGK